MSKKNKVNDGKKKVNKRNNIFKKSQSRVISLKCSQFITTNALVRA